MYRQAGAAGAGLVVFPEALIGGYPKGLTFGATVGNPDRRGPQSLPALLQTLPFLCPGAETEMLAGWARELNWHMVIGVIERGGGTLYCTSLVFSPSAGLISNVAS